MYNIKNKKILVLVVSLLLQASFLLLNANYADAAQFQPINDILYVGSRGQDVTDLQTFLASNKNIYPEGLITGYYGSLTAKAVSQFQLAYDIQPVGSVGPVTLAKMNEVINAGRGVDIYAPAIYNRYADKTNKTATFSWSTNEMAKGKIFYSTMPFSMIENTRSFTEPTISGGSVMAVNNYASSQGITISGLSPNTKYYYIIESIDQSGNVNITNTNVLVTNN
ncbi:MAG: peptidoglycan-binding domain-containing protein [Candidatus Pacebacteria bacterium]|nr:peptidoglycan-binding domain-containing protein [Candidatus Paceibacterota bacterium]